jgi:hypothetical protein
MTTETPTQAPQPPLQKTVFLGISLPIELKDKIASAAKQEDRSMSNYVVRIFENHFANNTSHA